MLRECFLDEAEWEYADGGVSSKSFVLCGIEWLNIREMVI